MPDTRPGITFNEEGICSACQSYEHRKSIDWDERWKELEIICNKYRGMNGNGYDCAIAVSGGKDSHFQVHLMKEEMHMNPILFTVEDNFPMTEAGKHNLRKHFRRVWLQHYQHEAGYQNTEEADAIYV